MPGQGPRINIRGDFPDTRKQGEMDASQNQWHS